MVSRAVLGMGAPLIDDIIFVDEDFIKNVVTGSKGGMETVDYNLLCHYIEQSKSSPHITVGGGESNTIRALARLGHSCGFIGKVGNDKEAEQYRSMMQDHGVEPLLSVSEKTPTGQVLCMVTPDGERTMRTYLGASVELTAKDLNPQHFIGAELFYLSAFSFLNGDLTMAAMKLAKENGLKIVLGLASFEVVRQFQDEILYALEHYVDIVFANEEEACVLAEDESEACDLMAKWNTVSVVHMGTAGSWINYDGKKEYYPVIPVDSVDTTGAGDFFAAGFLHGYLSKMPIETCLHYAAALGAEIVQAQGTQLRDEQWDNILKTNEGLTV